MTLSGVGGDVLELASGEWPLVVIMAAIVWIALRELGPIRRIQRRRR